MLSVEQQIAALRPTIGYAAHFHLGLLWIAALGIVAAVVFWHPVPLMFALFFGLIGLAERQAGPNIVAAISAYDAEKPTVGSVVVSMQCWDMDWHYHAVVKEPNQPDWTYTFVPQGWQPAAQTYSAKIWRFASAGPPVLAVVEHGILIPRKPATLVESAE
jgi:hypothetical protein